MYDDDIEKLNEWFRKIEPDSYGTYHHTPEDDGEDVYAVQMNDMEAFCDYLRENTIDLIGIPCMVGTDGIWFRTDDLERAKYY